MPYLAHVFEERGMLDRLEDFTSRFGAQFYGLPRNEGKIRISREPVTVPPFLQHGALRVAPFLAGATLNWSIKDSI